MPTRTNMKPGEAIQFPSYANGFSDPETVEGIVIERIDDERFHGYYIRPKESGFWATSVFRSDNELKAIEQ